MTTLTARTTSLVTVALLALFMAAVWLMFKPTFVSGSTYAMFAAVIVATAAIAINAWHNAQPSTITSEVIHEAEVSRPAR